MAGNTPAADDRVERGESLEIADHTGSITATKIYTPKGERLELQAGETSIRLDAIELEALSWQDADFYGDLVAETATDTAAGTTGGEADVLAPDAGETEEPLVRVSNEYSEVVVGRVPTDGGDALHVASEPLHYEIALRPVAIAAVVQQNHGLFSQLLNQPYGPMDH